METSCSKLVGMRRLLAAPCHSTICNRFNFEMHSAECVCVCGCEAVWEVVTATTHRCRYPGLAGSGTFDAKRWSDIFRQTFWRCQNLFRCVNRKTCARARARVYSRLVTCAFSCHCCCCCCCCILIGEFMCMLFVDAPSPLYKPNAKPFCPLSRKWCSRENENAYIRIMLAHTTTNGWQRQLKNKLHSDENKRNPQPFVIIVSGQIGIPFPHAWFDD